MAQTCLPAPSCWGRWIFQSRRSQGGPTCNLIRLQSIAPHAADPLLEDPLLRVLELLWNDGKRPFGR